MSAKHEDFLSFLKERGAKHGEAIRRLLQKEAAYDAVCEERDWLRSLLERITSLPVPPAPSSVLPAAQPQPEGLAA